MQIDSMVGEGIREFEFLETSDPYVFIFSFKGDPEITRAIIINLDFPSPS